MRIAITSKYPELTSRIDNKLSQSKYWIVYDTNNRIYEVIDLISIWQKNEKIEDCLIDKIYENKIDLIVSGNDKPEIIKALKDAKIECHQPRKVTINEEIELIQQENRIDEGVSIIDTTSFSAKLDDW